MNSQDFIFWLNGYLELSNAKELNEQQIQIIKDHIALVLKKVTPDNSITVIGHSGDIKLDSSSPVTGTLVDGSSIIDALKNLPLARHSEEILC